jgi:quercetin dioxygenase-like cupin family protein/sugar lactone lactonase YvrE
MGQSDMRLAICLAFAGCGGAKGAAAVPTATAPLVASAAAEPARDPPAPATARAVTRKLLVRSDIPGAPGMESRIYLMEFPPGVASPPHVHTVQGTGYVLQGAFESAFDDETPAIKRAGDAFIDAPGRTHHFRNLDPDHPLRFVFSGNFPKGAPIFRSPDAVVRFGGPGVVQTIRKPALYPETVDYDPAHGAFVVGSFRDGAIYRIDGDGGTTRFADDHRLASTLGIKVDAAHGRLWAVSADVGVSVRRSAAGPRRSADVGVYDLSSGAPIVHVDLAGLVSGPHLLNGVAVDLEGNAYVSDSLSPVVYRITKDGKASVFARDDRFAGPGINLNGIVFHPHGFLLVVKKSDGTLFKVPLDDPGRVSQVQVDGAFVGGDGLLLVGEKDLVVVANATPAAATNAAYALATNDDWATAKIYDALPLGNDYPTTAVLRDGTIFVVSTKLDALLHAEGSASNEAEGLHAEATIRPIGSVAVSVR